MMKSLRKGIEIFWKSIATCEVKVFVFLLNSISKGGV
jgi:hypothetical protein